MMLNILVLPCGSEIGLEIHRSLKYSRHVKLFGASSVNDHGKFVFENYISGLPFYTDSNFISEVNKIIDKYKIDAVYPAMDSVIAKLSEHQHEIKCKIIGSLNETNQICLSKTNTYELLNDVIFCPEIYSLENIKSEDFPLFMKPDIGYGSRGALKVESKFEVEKHLKIYPNAIITEYLPGEELTIDCFTDRKGELRFYGPRIRKRVSNGISVNTIIYKAREKEINELVHVINSKVQFRGAWFAQVKVNKKGHLTLLEIAARFGGSSSLYRNTGINFALLSVFDAFDYDIELFQNDFDIELDRALNNKYKIDISYDAVYIDFDDCLIIQDKVNTQLLAFIYQCINQRKHVFLITKHEFNINKSLKKFRLHGVFDKVIHIKKEDQKYKYIKYEKSIFIDDSHKERLEVHQHLKLPVFAPDNIESLLK